jgi:hypothetical protein
MTSIPPICSKGEIVAVASKEFAPDIVGISAKVLPIAIGPIVLGKAAPVVSVLTVQESLDAILVVACGAMVRVSIGVWPTVKRLMLPLVAVARRRGAKRVLVRGCRLHGCMAVPTAHARISASSTSVAHPPTARIAMSVAVLGPSARCQPCNQ